MRRHGFFPSLSTHHEGEASAEVLKQGLHVRDALPLELRDVVLGHRPEDARHAAAMPHHGQQVLQVR